MMGGKEAYLRIRQCMEAAVADRVFPGAVLLWAEGERIMFHEAFGATDRDGGRRVDPRAVYDLASLTKILATTPAVAELVRDGRLGLSTPLADIIPGAGETDKAGITVDMLLRHTSGLPAHRPYFKNIDPNEPDPRKRLRQMVLDEPLDAPPGTSEVYSDLGFILLAWGIESVSGSRLDRFVRERIYSPLGIDRLFFIPLPPGEDAPGKHPGNKAVVPTSCCAWRGRTLAGEVEDENAWAAGGVEGHAGLFGDALSVFRLCREILAAASDGRPRVLDGRVIRRFLRPCPGRGRVAGFDTPTGERPSAGTLFSRAGIGHLGFTGTSVWMDPEQGRTVILLSNRVHPSRDNRKIKEFRPRIHDLISSESNTNIQV